ncbi:MAG: hypothetical protein ACYSTS_04915 [Planctomycetota bacterium]|jgi:hypothetical protein
MKKAVDVSVPKILKYNNDDIVKHRTDLNNSLMIITTSSKFSTGAKRIADHEKIHTKKVNSNIPFGFDYENFIQLACFDSIKITDESNVEIV